MINLIAAVSRNGQIGLHNKMPWHLPEDLAYFKSVTTHHTVLMGRKTFESIGHPLPNRRNIVLTKDLCYHAEGIEIIHSIEEALDICHTLNSCFIIGGGEIYNAFLPYADYLYLTIIDQDFEGDTAFPAYDKDFKCIRSMPPKNSDLAPFPFSFTIWKRIS